MAMARITGKIFPAYWTPQSAGERVKLVPLNCYNGEYESVVTNFFTKKHCRYVCASDVLRRYETTILSVERIHNPGLYQRYMARKAVLDKQNPGLENEKTLFHGTPSENTASINMHGFDPSKHNKQNYRSIDWYGDGAYFALSAHYSAWRYITKSDTSGHRSVYQCKVLVGYPCQGNEELKTLPIRSGTVPYDSATDDVDNPGEYVIFQNDSAYPEYLFTFKNPQKFE